MNPAEHEARNEASRQGVFVGTDVDRIEAGAIADARDDEAESYSSWFIAGEGRPA